jgi:hypothetical protein
MAEKEIPATKMIPKAFKIIFYFCAFYFFLMGSTLIFIPGFLIKGFSNIEVNPIIIGMLRGAGGSIIPYSLFYILIALNPFNRRWALSFILLANVTAIILDTVSLLLGEYKLSYTMIDLPVELASIIGLIIIWRKIKISIDNQSDTRKTPTND